MEDTTMTSREPPPAGPGLTERQVRHFLDNGYLRLPGRLDDRTCAALLERVRMGLATLEPPVRRDDNGRPVRLSRVFERDQIFRDLFSSELIIHPLRSLLGPNIVFVQNRHNHATLNHAEYKANRPHRDVLQWSRPVITALVYLENATPSNGCTTLIPGSQHLPYVGTPNNGGTWMDAHSVYQDLLEQLILVPMSAGSVLLLNSLTFHAAGVNTSAETRIVLSAAYRAADELLESERADANVCLVAGEWLYRGDS